MICQTSLLTRALEDRRGTVIINFAIMATVLFGITGGAIDFNRWAQAKRGTEAAVDAAVLAGVRSLQINPNNPEIALSVAREFYKKNVPAKLELTVNTVDFQLGDNNMSINAIGKAEIGTKLLGLMGINSLKVINDTGSGLAKAKLQIGGQGGSNLEISLVLDVTGSMCNDGNGPCTSSTRMDGLKDAAKKLVDMVIASNQSNYYSKMAIVPFSTRVRVGKDGAGGGIMKALTNLDPVWNGWYKMCTDASGTGDTSEGAGTWTCNATSTQQYFGWKVMPCVTDRFYDNGWAYDYTDDVPGSGKWLNAHDGGRMTKAWDSSDTTPTTDLGTSTKPATHWNYDGNGQCYDVAEANEVMPLSNDKDALKSKIDSLEAYGSTAGALGVAWGWYTLSPKWHTIWTGDKRPGEYADLTTKQANGKPKLRKVVVIMSDGVFNTFRSWKDQDQQQVSNYAKELCKQMKGPNNDQIEIFTVGLGLDQLPDPDKGIAKATLEACGTDINHFYSTLDVAELQTAFQDIAYQLTSIALAR